MAYKYLLCRPNVKVIFAKFLDKFLFKLLLPKIESCGELKKVSFLFSHFFFITNLSPNRNEHFEHFIISNFEVFSLSVSLLKSYAIISVLCLPLLRSCLIFFSFADSKYNNNLYFNCLIAK